LEFRILDKNDLNRESGGNSMGNRDRQACQVLEQTRLTAVLSSCDDKLKSVSDSIFITRVFEENCLPWVTRYLSQLRAFCRCR
jgi:hypothetical protein